MLLKCVRNISMFGFTMQCSLLPLEGCSALMHDIAMTVKGEVCRMLFISVSCLYWLLGLWSDHVTSYCYIIY